MIQLVINTTLLRELDERKLINAYARYMYNDELDTTDDIRIRENLIQLFDWDINGDNGLGIYCSKFESLKEKDWIRLVEFIKENHHEIKSIAYTPNKERKLESIKVVNDAIEAKKIHNKERFTSENYEVSGRGKKARPCVYEGREYKSRQECMYKEGLTKYHLWKYLKDTNQI
jgi:hypothetical protein